MARKRSRADDSVVGGKTPAHATYGPSQQTPTDTPLLSNSYAPSGKERAVGDWGGVNDDSVVMIRVATASLPDDADKKPLNRCRMWYWLFEIVALV